MQVSRHGRQSKNIFWSSTHFCPPSNRTAAPSQTFVEGLEVVLHFLWPSLDTSSRWCSFRTKETWVSIFSFSTLLQAFYTEFTPETADKKGETHPRYICLSCHSETWNISIQEMHVRLISHPHCLSLRVSYGNVNCIDVENAQSIHWRTLMLVAHWYGAVCLLCIVEFGRGRMFAPKSEKLQCYSNFDHKPTRRVASRELRFLKNWYYLCRFFGEQFGGDGRICAIYGIFLLILGLREYWIALSPKKRVGFA